jgi:Ca2+-binding EF-hand superfamily protein
VSQLEGGAEGSFYQEIVDHFYYAQLRAQGEDTTEPRRITGEVPISQLGNMMRSLGFYPSQREVDELTQEARLCATARESGSNDALAFDEFLVMYINHRPIFGVSKEQITAAFATISTDGSGTLARESLLRSLASHDESLAGDDLEQCLRMLTGVDDPALAIGDKVDAKTFAEQVLGFQDYTAASA